MKLAAALALRREAEGRPGPPRLFDLVCGFEALHLLTFLEAELLSFSGGGGCRVRSGRFGDLEGNIERASVNPSESVIVVVEWPDIDPRLGIRWEADWRDAALHEIGDVAAARFARIRTLLTTAVLTSRVVVVPPGSNLPPLFHEAPGMLGRIELALREAAARFSVECGQISGVHVIRPLSQDTDYDARLELSAGFPFSITGAARLAARIAPAAVANPPLKGLITDLDNTLWRGVAGEDGEDNLTWEGERGRAFGLYQQVLNGLLDAGFLVGIASKNEQATVARAFSRKDLLVQSELLYPLEVSWGPKSAAVSRILAAWNIGPESVAFVDDDPRELAEVGRAWPTLRLLQCPGGDPQQMLTFLVEIRRLFSRDRIVAEDRLRVSSVIAASSLEGTAASDDFHLEEKGCVRAELVRDRGDLRAFELINKTNQFNLNGVRLAEANWLELLSAYPITRVITFDYANRFGKLGRIAAVVVSKQGERHIVSSFVLSCRAFARRVEYGVIAFLFERIGCGGLDFRFRPTARNEPIVSFFRGLLGSVAAEEQTLSLTIETFGLRAPLVAIQMEEIGQWKIEDNA